MTRLAVDATGAPIPAVALGASEAVSYTAIAAQSGVFSETTTLIRIASTSDCYIEFGDNPTATSSSSLLPGAFVEYFKVTPGQRLSVLQVSEAGVLSVSVCL